MHYTFTVRCGRSSQQKSSFLRGGVSIGTGRIPQFGKFLPFINQMRRFPFECGRNVDLDKATILEVASRISDKKFAFGMMSACPCLAAPFRPFNAYSAEDTQIRKNFCVDGSFLVSLNLHLIHLWARMISNFRLVSNFIRLDLAFPFG